MSAASCSIDGKHQPGKQLDAAKQSGAPERCVRDPPPKKSKFILGAHRQSSPATHTNLDTSPLRLLTVGEEKQIIYKENVTSVTL